MVVLLGAMAVAGCVAAEQFEIVRVRRDIRRVAAAQNECFDAIKADPAFRGLSGKSVWAGREPPPAVLANNNKPTQDDVLLLFMRRGASQACRKQELEAMEGVHPSFGGEFVEYFTGADGLFLQLVTGQVSWGENARRIAQIAAAANDRVKALPGVIGKQVNTGSWYTYEAQERQRVSALFPAWTAVQEQIEVQRQALAPSTRSTIMRCQYVGGRTLQCAY
ncbi:hypothetical protein [Reyranella sp. CPCC 100927]|uniref:hypothetical protein n=1 Tax=Reyranella sp. CPCC 100927 TaxID=2599616 RepID=UPI0011B7F0C3|nr:hypothetical protein [Reyranella sp. CPCC 100927]TWT10760.1 hypothetical protein FQU96_16785 [Reyranella sp. CPCC 100927]